MDLLKNLHVWQGYQRWTTSGVLLYISVWLLNVATPHAVSAAASKIQGFDGNAYSGLPMFTCGTSGWSIEQTNRGNRVVAMCPNMCIYELSVIEDASFGGRGSGTVTFSYAINVLDGSSISDDPEIRPVLSLYCDNCSNDKVWSSVDTSASRTDGVWVLASVVIKSRGTFSLKLEAKIGASGQVIGVDDVVVQGTKPQSFPLPTIPLEIPLNCDSREDPNENDANMQSTTQTPGEEVEDTGGYPLTIGFQTTINTDVTTPKSSGSDYANSFKLLDHEMTLLLAQILAVLSVAVCVVTITVHCVIWGRQRKLQKVRSIDRQRAPEPDPRDSMLLEMNLIPTEEPDTPCSNSLCRPAKDIYLAKLRESDILKQQYPRRATISHGISPPRQGALLDVSDDSDVEQQRPHPRTKSLPGRPVNDYESIDEMSKYQPLRFEKRPAPKQKPPGIPGGGRLNERTRGVQNLAAARKNRPSSVQYEEVRKRTDVLFEEPRDRSKSASNYDYIKRKASSQMPRRSVLKYGQSPRTRPKGRAPPPPVNRLYDKPSKKTNNDRLMSSAPQLLLIKRDSSRESVRTDTESIPDEDEGYNNPRMSTFGTPVRPVRPAVESAYFTLEPTTVDYSTGDSDDERESPPDASRFEDADEATATPRNLPNGRGGNSLGPMPVSAPIIIPPSPVLPNVEIIIENYDEEETSHL
ncbi:uncharacterized protein [Asterias amurensis]|uniref:uncharacterized protein n=1 Tax=Asterias amurensis TaxID=7602 RepID=UPI003AB221D2